MIVLLICPLVHLPEEGAFGTIVLGGKFDNLFHGL